MFAKMNAQQNGFGNLVHTNIGQQMPDDGEGAKR